MGDLTIRFLGGADEIGASSAVVSAGGTNLLVDCGIRFEAGRALPDLAELSGRDLDAILVTHAPTDHTGGLPVAHEAFPAVPIHMSPPTEDLVRILQKDALRLMAEGWEREGEVPLYNETAVESMLHVTRGVKYAESFRIGEVEVTYLPASHILGASMVHLATPAGSVLFTGDYSVEAQRTVPALDRPPLRADVVITESTYGDRLHADRKAAERRLITQVRETLSREGRVLIPAFAIGRAQEVLLILRTAFDRGELPEAPVFVDGMVRAVCEVYARHPRYVTNALAKRMRSGHPFYDERIRPVKSADERKKALETRPSVIVSSSGMLSGGPSVFYAGELAGHERDAILLTGYQDEESPGRALLRLAEAEGPRTLRLGEREIEVRCAFTTYGLSAHADRMQMVGLVTGLRPECAVLVHGDAGAKRSLAGSLGLEDVVHAANGDRVVRGYRSRRRPPPKRREIEIGAEQARRL
ncbi:MAG: MBL fold metallo-hydrolase, partial [Candidatus Latescibacteria bacterium]|nr:MBL fold metallo-hydrolase [Candidatus Latescibacterota bacterium]